MKELITNKGNKVLVDDFNYERLKHLKLSEHGIVVGVRFNDPKTKQSSYYPLSKIILLTDKPVIDHKDRNHLNFQVSNLRPCSQAENIRNRRKFIGPSSSKYKGVYFHKECKKWAASISIEKKRIYLGLFNTELEAAKAYNEASEKYHGEFGVKNVLQ